MKCLYIITVLVMCLAGCRTQIKYVPVESKHDSIYIDRLVPYPIPADSATIRALMECDENGKVILRWLDIANTKNIELQFKIDSLGHVLAKMKATPDTLYLPSKEIYVERKVEVPVPVERELSKWEQTCIDLFPYVLGMLVVSLFVVLRKPMITLIRRFI